MQLFNNISILDEKLKAFPNLMNTAKGQGDMAKVVELEGERNKFLLMSQRLKGLIRQNQKQGSVSGGSNMGGGGMSAGMNTGVVAGMGHVMKDNSVSVTNPTLPLATRSTSLNQIQNQQPSFPNFQSNQAGPSQSQQPNQMQGMSRVGSTWQGTLSWAGFDAATQGKKEVRAQVEAFSRGGNLYACLFFLFHCFDVGGA